MIDYTIHYKEEVDVLNICEESWDIFISAFNSSERVKQVFEQVNAADKYWLVQGDYEYQNEDLPSTGNLINPSTQSESEFAKKVIFEIGIETLKSKSVCIDITGFVKPYMLTLLSFLKRSDCDKFDVLYSEPIKYSKREETKFSGSLISEVKQVVGYGGMHRSDTSNDYLIVGSGYDHDLIAYVAEDKANTRKVQMFGFPSLKPDMYQENILRAHRAKETMDGINIRNKQNVILAPANDPFVTASELSKFYFTEHKKKPITNLYLSPLATKPQALGFALFYLTEFCDEDSVSMIYPFSYSHSKETSKGLSRIWKYSLYFEST